ncbi:TPA: hypothetical protein U1D09_000248 [Streptococcus suis]|nr:hypothetical protein [Streptococcus suis]
MGIDNHLKVIKEGVFGRDVRQAIHDGIKQAYEDGTANGNANMEVSQARGSYPNLSSRLWEVDEQLAQKANQAFVDAQFASIVSGAPKGTYTDLTALQSAYPNGAEGIFLVLSNGHWYYWNSTTSAWTDGGVYQATGTSEFSATNLIKNGDGSNGVSGWVATAGTHANINGEIEMTADGSQVYNVGQRSLEDLTIGHKYYLKANVRVDNSDASLIGLLMIHSPESIVTISNPVENQNYTISGIFTATQATQQFYIRHQYADTNTALGKKLYVDNVVTFNVSKTFGGKIPTLKQLNEIMGYLPNMYFDGSKAPLVDNTVMFNIFNDLRLKTLAGRVIKGTTKQIDVEDGGGTVKDPVLSIPKNPMLLQPQFIASKLGDNIAPAFDTLTGINATFSNGQWKVEPNGQLKCKVTVEANKAYVIKLGMIDTNNYAIPVTNVPHMRVTLGATQSAPLFLGFSDAMYEVELASTTGGEVDLIFGSGSDGWYGTFNSLSVRQVLERVTPSGKIGIGSFDITTYSSSLSLGNGLQKRSTGDNNIAFGLNSQRDNTTGHYNVSTGGYTLEQNTDGCYNTAIGYSPLRKLRTGYYNIGIGYATMLENIDGSWNIAIGNETLRDMAHGERNTVVGSRALNSMTEGNCNVAMGREAGFYPNGNGTPTTKGDFNTFLGYRSGQYSLENANRAVALGANATTHTDATALGYGTLAGGQGSVAIGRDSSGQSAKTYLKDEIKLGTENHRVKIDGKLNLPTKTPVDDGTLAIGDVFIDENYIYIKTNGGIKKAQLLA